MRKIFSILFSGFLLLGLLFIRPQAMFGYQNSFNAGQQEMAVGCSGGDCAHVVNNSCGSHCLFAATKNYVVDLIAPQTINTLALVATVFIALAFVVVSERQGAQYAFAYRDWRQILTIQKRE